MLDPSCQRVISDTLLRAGASFWLIKKNLVQEQSQNKQAGLLSSELEKAFIYLFFLITGCPPHVCPC